MNYKLLYRSSQLFIECPDEITELNKSYPILADFNISNILKFRSSNRCKKFNVNDSEHYLDELSLYQIATLLPQEELKKDDFNDLITKDINRILNKTSSSNLEANAQLLVNLYDKYNNYNKNSIDYILISIMLNKITFETALSDIYINLIEKLILKLNNEFLYQISQCLENTLQLILTKNNVENYSESEYEDIRKQDFKNLIKLINFITNPNKSIKLSSEKHLILNTIEHYYLIILNSSILNKVEYIIILLDGLPLNINNQLSIFNQIEKYIVDSYKTIEKNYRIRFLLENIIKKYNFII